MNLTALLGIKTATIALAAAAFLIAGSGVSPGQAGRRLPQSRPTRKSEPPPSPTPQPPKTAKALFSLKIVRDIPQTLYLSFNFPEHMEEWTVARLKKSSLLEINPGGQANHAEAVRLAKAETESLVVWLQLDENPLATPDASGRRTAFGHIKINYSIFAPITGKLKYSGSTPVDESIAPVGVRRVEALCYPTVRGDDYLLLLASLEAATRIMNYLKVTVPSSC
jgi:hypothetical protein